jgi:hypothetical protein
MTHLSLPTLTRGSPPSPPAYDAGGEGITWFG